MDMLGLMSVSPMRQQSFAANKRFPSGVRSLSWYATGSGNAATLDEFAGTLVRLVERLTNEHFFREKL